MCNCACASTTPTCLRSDRWIQAERFALSVRAVKHECESSEPRESVLFIGTRFSNIYTAVQHECESSEPRLLPHPQPKP
jgi:hypothetical protein